MRRCLIALVLTAACRAQPPTVVQTGGLEYEIQSCAGLGDDVWLGGTVDRDGFLTRLGPDGRSLWQRRFGGDGEDGVDAVTPLTDGGGLVAGHCHSDLALAWAGQPELDWGRQSFLARVGPQGELLKVVDVRAAGEAQEPFVKIHALAAREGQVWVGGRLDGSLWGLSSRGPQAFVALLDQNLQPLKASLLDGYEVTQLQVGAQGCLAAGVRKGEKEQVSLWSVDSTGTARESWKGSPAPPACNWDPNTCSSKKKGRFGNCS